MALKIKANTLIYNRNILVDERGVEFYETAFIGGKRRFGFHQIQVVLLSNKNILSFQVGIEVFSLPVKPDKRKHAELIETLVSKVKCAHNKGL